MQFSYSMHTNILFERGCVSTYADQWIRGTRAYVVAGARSGRLSGAIQDVEQALQSRNVRYEIFEGVANNPTVEQCRILGGKARAFGADFIVGIGGGSPLDAAKAVAVFAKEDITTDELYSNAFRAVLPLIAIPTTAGTGSEVTPWSILTRHDIQTKRSFGNAKTQPVVALLDADYTRTIPLDATRNTAMDACTHCMESYLGLKGSPVTDGLNLEALRRFGKCLPALAKGQIDNIREELMLVSVLGGMTIAHTGTTLMHGMGYPLTYYKGLPHGEANCAVLPGYFAFVHSFLPEKVSAVMDAMGISLQQFCALTREMIPLRVSVTSEEAEHFAAQVVRNGSAGKLVRAATQQDIEGIYLNM